MTAGDVKSMDYRRSYLRLCGIVLRFADAAAVHPTGHGFTFQIPAAYSAIVRSLENFPEPATFKIVVRAHALGLAYKLRSR